MHFGILCFFFLQQVNYVVNESYKTVQEVSRNLDGENHFCFILTAAMRLLLSARLTLVFVFISHRASAGSRDPEEIQRNSRPGAELSQTPGPRYGVSACSVLYQPERVSACVHILTKRSAIS